MRTWIIISWVFVAILTAINIFVFIKLRNASMQMMKMAFPGAKNMGDALSQMEGMLKSMRGQRGKKMAPGGFGMPGQNSGAGGNQQAQLQSAMNMLKNLQQGKRP